MAQLFPMPQLGSTMEEGTILKWHKHEGDSVRKGEILLEIETDKATMEVEAPCDGMVRKLFFPEEAVIPVQKPIAILGTPEEPIEHLLAEAGFTGFGGGITEGIPAAAGAPASQTTPAPTASRSDTNGTVCLSPRARRLAEARGVEPVALAGRGSGPGGRVVERDVLAYLEEGGPAAEMIPETKSLRTTPLAARIADELGVDLNDLAAGLPGSRVRREDVLRHAQAPPTPSVAVAEEVGKSAPVAETYTMVPFGGMRRRIADNVGRSRFTAPHVTLTLEVDMTDCGELRSRLIPDMEKVYGVRLSFTDILVKASARALQEYPQMNATLVNDEIRIYKRQNIGVAVALEEGLIVPVVKDAGQKSLGAIAAELKPLIERARSGKFTPDDLAEGTFSITNLGAFGIDVFDPIIVPPQAAILGVGRIADKPVVIAKQVVIRSMMNLCLSFDHRVVDGAPAARFLQRLKELLENPLTVLI